VGTGRAAFSALGNDIGAITRAATTGSESGIGSACAILESDAAAAASAAKIPVHALEITWATGLADILAASGVCIQATELNDQGQFTTAFTDMTSAGQSLGQLRAQITGH
jgi:hypothetical protein